MTSLHESLAVAKATLAGRVSPNAIVVLGGRCRRIPPRRLLDLPDELLSGGSARHPRQPGGGAETVADVTFAWDGRDAGDPADDAFTVGRGEVLRLTARGADRVRSIRTAAATCEGPPGARSAPLRWFGGLSFATGAESEAFAPFGEASFSVPRVLLTHERDAACLELAVRGSELDGCAELEAEIDRILSWLDRASPPVLTPANPGRHRRPFGLDPRERADYEELVRDALRLIEAGALEKVVAARSREVSLPDPARLDVLFERLRSHQPGTIRFAFRRGEHTFLGASPERLVTRAGDRVRTDALAGSMRRGAGGPADLLASEKDRREHRVVVDAITHTLECRGGRVQGPPAPLVKSLRDVLHLWTPLTARHITAHVLELVAELHPTPAMCGSPMEGARSWITSREPSPRGWYSAPVGWFDDRGHGAFAVAIRSALVCGSRARVFGGAGIVSGSDPMREFDETEVKLAAMLDVLGTNTPPDRIGGARE